MVQQLINTESTHLSDPVDELDISHLTIEDDTPVDNFQSAQQQRLLVDGLCSNEILPLPFIAEANVGLFYTPLFLICCWAWGCSEPQT